MSHLDEGTLHALLDGELELAEVKEAQQHLGTCAACGSRLQDVKQFLAEADRLVGTLEIPTGAGGTRTESAAPPPLTESAAPPPLTPSLPPYREPLSWAESPPPLLLPESVEGLGRRIRLRRALKWAAMIVLVLGGGRLVSGLLHPSKPELQLSERDLTSTAQPTPKAVVSPQESGRPESSSAVVAAKEARPVTPRRTRLAKPAAPESKVPADEPSSDSARSEGDSAAAVAADTVAEDRQTLAAGARQDSETINQISGNQDLATRRAAAAALAELDRQRLRDRANAATAALPPAQPEPQPPPEAPPPPRTLEQRAQVYLRIGLDEAVKQLGRPVHVIEAMTPEFIGLTPGRLVAGADATRPVVRVVYLDTRGRLIMLDQQRMRTGQAPGAPAGSLRWTLGDVMLYLHGDPSTEVLRGLQRRVR